MNTRWLAGLLAFVILCGVPRWARAQDELPTPAKERNAALLYWQYFLLWNASDLAPLEFPDDPVWIPDEAMGKALAEF